MQVLLIDPRQESMEMLGIIGDIWGTGRHPSHTAQTGRSPVRRVKPDMEVEEMPDVASSPGSPCSPDPLSLSLS